MKILKSFPVFLAITVLQGGLVHALEKPTFTDEQLSEFGRYDYETIQKVVGTWFFESISANGVHAAQRIRYFDDMTFVSDYRISSPGSVTYRRASGIWYCLMGWFCEEETSSSDDRGPSRMVRWVNSINEQELQVESRTGMAATMKREKKADEQFDRGVKALDEKQLDRDFASRGIIGYVPEEVAGGDYERWILRSEIGGSDKPAEKEGEQAGTGQPATRSESKSEGGDKPQPDSEGRSR